MHVSEVLVSSYSQATCTPRLRSLHRAAGPRLWGLTPPPQRPSQPLWCFLPPSRCWPTCVRRTPVSQPRRPALLEGRGLASELGHMAREWLAVPGRGASSVTHTWALGLQGHCQRAGVLCGPDLVPPCPPSWWPQARRPAHPCPWAAPWPPARHSLALARWWSPCCLISHLPLRAAASSGPKAPPPAGGTTVT